MTEKHKIDQKAKIKEYEKKKKNFESERTFNLQRCL